MKKIFLFSIIICLSLIEKVTAQNWQWSQSAGGSNNEGCNIICTDPNDNVYISGQYYSNPCNFPSGNLSLIGSEDFFIAKYDASGNQLWAHRYGGLNSSMQLEGINTMLYRPNTNSLILAGGIYGTGVFDNDTLYGPCSFIGEMGTNGVFNWVKKFTSAGRLTIDNSGNIYIESLMSSSGMIDTLLVPAGLYISKLNPNGNLLWAKKIFNTNASSQGFDGLFLKLKIKDDKLFGLGLCTVDTLTVDTVTIYANFQNGQNILGCFDTSGTALWIKACAGNLSGGASGLDVDDNKNCYITGSFSQSAIFANDTIFNGNFSDLFLAKYDSSGNFIWVRQANASFSASGNDLALSQDDGVYITGSVYGSATFGTFTVNGAMTGTGDMFVARYDTTGACVGVRHLGIASGWGIACVNGGDFYCTGNFQNTVTFPSNAPLSSNGSTDVYIAKSSVITGIGGRESNPNNQLIIYSNPNKGTCNVTIPDEFKDDKNLTLQIFDNTGKLLQQIKVEMQEEKIKLNLEEEAKGIYNVILSNKKKSYNGKIIFE